jgi:hypothetical protein
MSYPASLFNIVGAAYIPERHLDSDCNHAEHSSSRRYGLGVPWLARDLDITNADTPELDRTVSDLLK